MNWKYSWCFLVILAFWSCKTFHTVDTKVVEHRMNDEAAEEDHSILEMIAPYKAELEKEMGRFLCQNELELTKGKPESTLTNWFADALMDIGKSHFDMSPSFAVQNYGGIRRGELPKGPVTVGLVYELMPFDNELVLLEMNGQQVQSFCNRMAQSGGWPISRELRFEIDHDLAKDVTINGESLSDDKKYYVVINDYIASGGDGLEMLKTVPQTKNGLLIRDGMINYLEGIDNISNVKLDKRIIIKAETE